MSPIGEYGSVAGGDGDAQDQAERAWYDQPVRRQNPYFLSFTLVLFLSLAVAGVTLNATGVVTFGPGQFKPEPLENLAICEVDFCGGGLLFSEDGVPVETQHRGPWINPLTQAQLSSCSKLRSDAAEDIEVVFIAAFDNPTGTPVQMDDLHVEFQRSGGAELGSCHVLETPTRINPAGNNRVDVDCVFKAAEVGHVVASWWMGEEITFVTTWGRGGDPHARGGEAHQVASQGGGGTTVKVSVHVLPPAAPRVTLRDRGVGQRSPPLGRDGRHEDVEQG